MHWRYNFGHFLFKTLLYRRTLYFSFQSEQKGGEEAFAERDHPEQWLCHSSPSWEELRRRVKFRGGQLRWGRVKRQRCSRSGPTTPTRTRGANIIPFDVKWNFAYLYHYNSYCSILAVFLARRCYHGGHFWYSSSSLIHTRKILVAYLAKPKSPFPTKTS